jgi:hypothetical protein
MFLNADRTIYGRFGTRSRRPEEEDMTVEGLSEAMQAVLKLHADYPKNKSQLAGKTGPAVEFPVPEEMPALKGKYGPLLDYEGEVVKSCVHCHQIRDAERQVYRSQNKEMPDEVLFPYPLPEAIGLRMDPKHRASVAEVTAGSAAAKAGLKAGDDVVSAASQPLISTADLQWVLHRTQDAAKIELVVRRDGSTLPLTLSLDAGWKKKTDISWRVSTWQLRGIATGGLLFEALPDEERHKASLADDKLALRIKHAGLYGIHGAAKNAGFDKGDILVSLDGEEHPLSESEVIARMLTKPAGTKVPATVLRGGKRLDLKLPIQ